MKSCITASSIGSNIRDGTSSGSLKRAYPASSHTVVAPTVGGVGWGCKGKPRSRQASKPPSSGRTRVMPRFFNRSATRALVASFGQVQ